MSENMFTIETEHLENTQYANDYWNQYDMSPPNSMHYLHQRTKLNWDKKKKTEIKIQTAAKVGSDAIQRTPAVNEINSCNMTLKSSFIISSNKIKYGMFSGSSGMT